jgi:hypothetical protein
MVELEKWDVNKIQKAANVATMKLHGTYLRFIEQKLGKDAVVECVSMMAKQEADIFKKTHSKESGALKIAVNQGETQKNLFGCDDVKVEGDENQAIVSIGKCPAIRIVEEFAKMGIPTTKETCCGGCRSYYANLSKAMGINNSDFVCTNEGCKYIYSKELSK